MKRYLIEESPFSHFFTADTRVAWLWLIVRVYLGWQWLEAGWEKLHDPAWTGSGAGLALTASFRSARQNQRRTSGRAGMVHIVLAERKNTRAIFEPAIKKSSTIAEGDHTI